MPKTCLKILNKMFLYFLETPRVPQPAVAGMHQQEQQHQQNQQQQIQHQQNQQQQQQQSPVYENQNLTRQMDQARANYSAPQHRKEDSLIDLSAEDQSYMRPSQPEPDQNRLYMNVNKPQHQGLILKNFFVLTYQFKMILDSVPRFLGPDKFSAIFD